MKEKREVKKVGGGLMREGEGWRRRTPKKTRKMERMEEVKRLEVEEKWEGVEEEQDIAGSLAVEEKVERYEEEKAEEEKNGGWRRCK